MVSRAPILSPEVLLPVFLLEQNITLGFAYQPVYKNSGTHPELLTTSYYEILSRPKKDSVQLAVAPFISEIEQSKDRAIEFDSAILQHALNMQHTLNMQHALNMQRAPRLGLNLSGWTVSSQDGFQRLSDILSSYPRKARRPVIEFTETVSLTNEAQARRMLTMLKQQGFKVALDDFGAEGTREHLTMKQVERLHPDILKFDYSWQEDLMADPKKQSDLISAIQSCKSLGIKTVVEGAKSVESVQWLMKIAGADMLQSHILCRPDSSPLRHRIKLVPAA